MEDTDASHPSTLPFSDCQFPSYSRKTAATAPNIASSSHNCDPVLDDKADSLYLPLIQEENIFQETPLSDFQVLPNRIRSQCKPLTATRLALLTLKGQALLERKKRVWAQLYSISLPASSTGCESVHAA